MRPPLESRRAQFPGHPPACRVTQGLVGGPPQLQLVVVSRPGLGELGEGVWERLVEAIFHEDLQRRRSVPRGVHTRGLGSTHLDCLPNPVHLKRVVVLGAFA